jgi:hypothetical protein
VGEGRLARELAHAQRIARDSQEQTRGVIRRTRFAWQQLEAADARRRTAVERFASWLAVASDLDGDGKALLPLGPLRDALRQLCQSVGVEWTGWISDASARAAPGIAAAGARRTARGSGEAGRGGTDALLLDEIDTLQTSLVALRLELARADLELRVARDAESRQRRAAQLLELELEAERRAAMASKALLREMRHDFAQAMRTVVGSGTRPQLSSAEQLERSTPAGASVSSARSVPAQPARPSGAGGGGMESRTAPPERTRVLSAAPDRAPAAVTPVHARSPSSACGSLSDSLLSLGADAAAELARLDADIAALTAQLRSLMTQP